MQLIFINHSGRRIPRKYLQQAMSYFKRHLPKKFSRVLDKELALVFLPESQAKALNLQYRKKNYATDVLSFQGDGDSLGELVFCPEVVARQAGEHHLSFRDELTYMCLHGLLHLLGYDHEKDKAQARAMFRLQDRLFDQFLQQR